MTSQDNISPDPITDGPSDSNTETSRVLSLGGISLSSRSEALAEALAVIRQNQDRWNSRMRQGVGVSIAAIFVALLGVYFTAPSDFVSVAGVLGLVASGALGLMGWSISNIAHIQLENLKEIEKQCRGVR